MDTAKISKFAIAAFILLILISIGIFLFLRFRKLQPSEEVTIDSSKTVLDTSGTGKQDVTLGLSEDTNWPSKQAGIKRYQMAGTLVKNPYLKESLVVFEIEVPIDSGKKIVKINTGALEGETASPLVVLTKVGKIGNISPSPESASDKVLLADLIGNASLQKDAPVVIQFFFSDDNEELSKFYNVSIPESGGCRSGCLDFLGKIKDQSGSSLRALEYLLGKSDEESLELYVFVSSIYVERK